MNKREPLSLVSRFPHPLLELQQHFGNRAIGRFIQAKLTVNAPGDIYEQETDHMAEQVMRMPAPFPAMSSNKHSPPALQRKCAACASGQGLCPQCAEEEETVQRKPLAAPIATLVQRQMVAGAIPAVSPSVESHIHSLRNGGQPLPESMRAFFEPRFGVDFSQVRVHTDSPGAISARALNARAFTLGRDIVFGAEEYKPTTATGKQLLAHELTHVVQQRYDAGLRLQFSRLLDYKGRDQEPAVSEFENTKEFKDYMDHNLKWQWQYKVTRDEALLACRIIWQEIRQGKSVDWDARAREFVMQARETLAKTKPPSEPKSNKLCGPDATKWFIDQVDAAKKDSTVLRIKYNLVSANNILSQLGLPHVALLALALVDEKVTAAWKKAGSPPFKGEAKGQRMSAFSGFIALAQAERAVLNMDTTDLMMLSRAKDLLQDAALIWKSLVQGQAKYDFKNNKLSNPRSEHCPNDCNATITFCNMCFLKDIPGNLFYAHVGGFIGWTELILQLGSQFAQLSSTKDWDPPEDTAMISLGFKLPDPLTEKALCDALKSAGKNFSNLCAICSEPIV